MDARKSPFYFLLQCTGVIALFLVSFPVIGFGHNELDFTPSSHSPEDSLEIVKVADYYSVDGPYIFVRKKQGKKVSVVDEGGSFRLSTEMINLSDDPTFRCEVNNEDGDVFSFKINKKIRIPNDSYKMPEKLLSISDIEGNFNGFYSLLVNNQVMDEQCNWTYGEGHLVLNGDFMDRGNSVTQCLWLIYKLEQEAELAGGKVHFILGNHEVMNLMGQIQYVDEKYVQLAKEVSGLEDPIKAYQYLMSEQQVLARWLRSKNVMERIGDFLFVHGGLSVEIIRSGLKISEINELVRKSLNGIYIFDPIQNQQANFLLGAKGPLWYRGLVADYRDWYLKLTQSEVNRVLKYFGGKHIVIGHTLVPKISTDYNGKVIRTDISHSPFKNSGEAEALLVENNQMYRVNDAGLKKRLD